jgi:preprotein translocase subunit SecA
LIRKPVSRRRTTNSRGLLGQRNRVFSKDDLAEDVQAMLSAEVRRHVDMAAENPAEAWKLLAWLEETQPTLNLDSDRPFPSYMIRLLIDSLAPDGSAVQLRSGLLELARASLQAQHEHLERTIAEQLDRSIERLEDQVRQRSDVADTAFEGALLEAEETGAPVDAQVLVRAVEEAAGVRLQLGDGGLKQIRESPDGFRRMIPRLVESGLGARVWGGLVQLAEARLGEPLALQGPLQTPIDWEAAERRLLEAVGQAAARGSETTLREIEQELSLQLPEGEAPSDALLARALVRMSYGQRTLFDRRTHQRRTMMVARLSYAFPASALLEGKDADELATDILDHLVRARSEVERSIGRAELRRGGPRRLPELPEPVRAGMARLLGEEAWEELEEAESLDGLPEERRETLEAAFGRVLLNEMYRGLILAVGDRLWVDYLTQMEGLRTAIGLEAYGQRDPLVQYKSRAFDMFSHLQADIRTAVVARLFRSPAPGRPNAAAPARVQSGEESPSAQVTSAPAAEGARKRRRRRH